MKHSALYLICSLLIFCRCSSEIIEESNIIDKPVPILITSNEVDIETKAIRNTFTSENISYIKIYGSNEIRDLYPEGINPVGLNENEVLSFSSSLLYPRDNSYVTLYGLYPSTVIQEQNQQITDNEITLSISGHDDLMYAKKEAGSKSNPTPVTFTFNHKLAQIKFKLNNCLTGDTTVTDNVTIIATGPSTATMSLTSGNLTEPTGTSSFELPTNLTFDRLSKDTSSPTEINGELLLFPMSAYSFSLKVGNNYYAVTFNGTTTTSWEASSIYTLTISINSLDNPLTDAPF